MTKISGDILAVAAFSTTHDIPHIKLWIAQEVPVNLLTFDVNEQTTFGRRQVCCDVYAELA